MKVNVEIDKNINENQILIKTNEMNDSVNAIIQKLSEETPKLLVGFIGDEVRVLDELEIIRFYSSGKKVFAVLKKDEYLMKVPLYEVMERLNQNHFVRISNAEIVNMKKVLAFDLNFIGTICIKLENGNISYVSRRYVSKIKQMLGIRGK